MNKYYIVYIILSILYIILFIVDMTNVCHIDPLYLQVSYILMWIVFLLVALKQMLTSKKTYRNYVLVAINLLILFLLIYRIITK